MGEGKAGGFSSLPLVLASPGVLVLVRRNRGRDVTEVEKGRRATKADEEFAQGRVQALRKVMRAVQHSRGRRGVRKAAKIGKKRLGHRGGPQTLLLTAHVRVCHGPHHFWLCVESSKCPMWVREVRPEDRGSGGASADASA